MKMNEIMRKTVVDNLENLEKNKMQFVKTFHLCEINPQPVSHMPASCIDDIKRRSSSSITCEPLWGHQNI